MNHPCHCLRGYLNRLSIYCNRLASVHPELTLRDNFTSTKYVSCNVQWNPALRTPALYGQFCLSRQIAHIFSLKLTCFIRTPVKLINTDNGHFSVSRVANSCILSTPLYGHWLAAHCLFPLSQSCDNCRHCTLFK